MSRWDDLIADERAAVLRSVMHEAAAFSHAENAARFDAEVLGDDPLIYGLMATNTARFRAGRLLEAAPLAGVTVCERGRVWWLEIQRGDAPTLRVYFYKAPPGATSIRCLAFDAEIKKAFTSSNGRQMALFSEAANPAPVELLNVVVVHFGDAVGALERLEVGAPFLVGAEVEWDWCERFDAARSVGEQTTAGALGDDHTEFGLRLVEPVGHHDDTTDDESGADHDRPAEPPTTEFDELRLVDDEADAEGGQEAT